MLNDIKLEHSLLVNNALGEGVIWDHRLQQLYWTDILQNKLYCWTFSGDLTVYPCPDKLCSFGLTTDPQWLICAFPRGFAFFNPISQALSWITQLELPEGTRLNDGRVDRQGRFWAGVMVDSSKGKQQLGKLYRLDFDATVSAQISGVQISNSLCWSPEGQRVYFADSPSRCIQSAEFDPKSGNIGQLHDFAHTEPKAFPDGACIDKDGCLWSAQWGSSTVKRYSPSGELLLTLTLPCKQPSCVTFAGPNLDHLCITSARQSLDQTQVSPNDGGLYIFSSPYSGLPEQICHMPMSVAKPN
ncbi:SMP-30/gluconolactonase/LRE family protein [Paraglaciecola sp. 25GB23A]|uniref:SMP-30/gluconolactonase/LRE family protein n=1 Tax=Paraglaciecola sp. 25GB23A TaxID=3156068 RepID=UPI0032AFDC2B